MVDLHVSVDEWNEESKRAKLGQRTCPRGHFLSWEKYNPISKVDQNGNPVYEHGTFCCHACGQDYDARQCTEIQIKQPGEPM